MQGKNLVKVPLCHKDRAQGTQSPLLGSSTPGFFIWMWELEWTILVSSQQSAGGLNSPGAILRLEPRLPSTPRKYQPSDSSIKLRWGERWERRPASCYTMYHISNRYGFLETSWSDSLTYFLWKYHLALPHIFTKYLFSSLSSSLSLYGHGESGGWSCVPWYNCSKTWPKLGIIWYPSPAHTIHTLYIQQHTRPKHVTNNF